MIIKFYKSFLLLHFFNTLRLITSIGTAIDGSSNKDNKVYCQSLYERPGKDYGRGTPYPPGIITETDDGNDRQTIWSG